jgi:ketosteroid isomerase-like protein
VLDDQRQIGFGVMDDPGAYAKSVSALRELASEVRIDTPFRVALEPHGVVSVVQVWGRDTQGGAFERTHLVLMTVDAGRVTRIEFFEPDQTERAVARLAELRGPPAKEP